MGFLCILGFGFEQPGILGHIVFAVDFADQGADIFNRVHGQVYRVGTHVGDQTGGFAADFDTFVQLLGNHHRAFGGKTQFPGGFLL